MKDAQKQAKPSKFGKKILSQHCSPVRTIDEVGVSNERKPKENNTCNVYKYRARQLNSNLQDILTKGDETSLDYSSVSRPLSSMN